MALSMAGGAIATNWKTKKLKTKAADTVHATYAKTSVTGKGYATSVRWQGTRGSTITLYVEIDGAINRLMCAGQGFMQLNMRFEQLIKVTGNVNTGPVEIVYSLD